MFCSPILEVSRLFAEIVQHGLRCISFCKTRKLCELVLSYTYVTSCFFGYFFFQFGCSLRTWSRRLLHLTFVIVIKTRDSSGDCLPSCWLCLCLSCWLYGSGSQAASYVPCFIQILMKLFDGFLSQVWWIEMIRKIFIYLCDYQ